MGFLWHEFFICTGMVKLHFFHLRYVVTVSLRKEGITWCVWNAATSDGFYSWLWLIHCLWLVFLTALPPRPIPTSSFCRTVSPWSTRLSMPQLLRVTVWQGSYRGWGWGGQVGIALSQPPVLLISVKPGGNFPEKLMLWPLGTFFPALRICCGKPSLVWQL